MAADPGKVRLPDGIAVHSALLDSSHLVTESEIREQKTQRQVLISFLCAPRAQIPLDYQT